MKKTLLALFILLSSAAGAQIFWTENFGTGCSQGTLAHSFVSTNGTWNVTNTGTNGTLANVWYISATEAGMGVGNCGDGCLGNPGLTNRTLHVGPNPFIGDAGAAYFAGPGSANTDVRAESPVINCTGRNNISVSFNYMMEGDAGNDRAGLAYFDGTSWQYYTGSGWSATFTALPVSNNASCNPQGLWTAHIANLPASANNNANVRVGFRWTNNDDGIGADPSFAADDITLNGALAPACSVSIAVTQPILCNGDCNGALLATGIGTGTITYWWAALPPAPFGNISNLCAGTYTVTITDNAACSATASFTLIEPTILVGLGAVTNVQCYGDCNGSASISPSGGTPGYTYTWSTGAATPGITNLCPGTYTVTVSDANNRTLSSAMTIMEPPLLALGNLTPSHPTCPGCTDGSICISNSSGGTPSYTYSISPTAGTFNGTCYINLPADTYTVCITDAHGCTACITDTLFDPPSGIGNLLSGYDVSLYPNPFNDDFYVEINNSSISITHLVIYDALGRNILTSESIGNKFHLSGDNLLNGVYFVELCSEKNQIIWRGRVFKL
jgi:hypothetical protein